MQDKSSSQSSVKASLTTEITSGVDGQASQFYTGVVALRQARVNQLQRESVALTAEYGPDDPDVTAVNASLTRERAAVTTLSVAKLVAAKKDPAAPSGGWVLYGHVLNSALEPVPKQTVMLVSDRKEWLSEFGYAFTDSKGYFVLKFSPTQAQVEAPSLTIQVLNEKKAIVFSDSAATTLNADQATYRDIVLPGGTIGTPPKGTSLPSEKD